MILTQLIFANCCSRGAKSNDLPVKLGRWRERSHDIGEINPCPWQEFTIMSDESRINSVSLFSRGMEIIVKRNIHGCGSLCLPLESKTQYRVCVAGLLFF